MLMVKCLQLQIVLALLVVADTFLCRGSLCSTCAKTNVAHDPFSLNSVWRPSTSLIFSARLRSKRYGGCGDEEGRRIADQASAWAATHGLLYANPSDQNQQETFSWTHAPIAALPNTFPSEVFEYLQKIQPIFNKLIDQVSRDKKFLLSSLLDLADSDDFIKKLLDIYQDLPESSLHNVVNLGILRSDYMLQQEDTREKVVTKALQIEINTIASSFGSLSNKVGDMHRYLLQRNAGSNQFASYLMSLDTEYSSDVQTASSMIPSNPSIRVAAFGMAMAHLLYGDNSAIVLFIVQPGERNFCDQRILESELWRGHGVKVEFMTLSEVYNRCKVDDGKHLRVQIGGSQHEVSVVYFRAGYSPDDYPSDVEWRAREMMELSCAIKCPTIAYQLSGAKRIQQRLSEPGMLERYLSSDECNLLRDCFVGQYNIGMDSDMDDVTRAAFQSAAEDGYGWVLKPQREGGGNNIYGKDVSIFLSKNRNTPLLSAYVLMQKIESLIQTTAFLRQGRIEVHPSISEYGIYGVFLGDNKDTPILNEYAGYLVRTKPTGVDEGGVATGYSVLSSMVLQGDKSNDHSDDDYDQMLNADIDGSKLQFNVEETRLLQKILEQREKTLENSSDEDDDDHRAAV